MDGSPYGMEDDMMGDMDQYGQEHDGQYEEGDPMDNSGQYGQEEGEYGEEAVSYKNSNLVQQEEELDFSADP